MNDQSNLEHARHLIEYMRDAAARCETRPPQGWVSGAWVEMAANAALDFLPQAPSDKPQLSVQKDA